MTIGAADDYYEKSDVVVVVAVLTCASARVLLMSMSFSRWYRQCVGAGMGVKLKNKNNPQPTYDTLNKIDDDDDDIGDHDDKRLSIQIGKK